MKHHAQALSPEAPTPVTAAQQLTERLPWTEIQARYPEQWVILIDAEWIRGQVRSGRVLYAGKKVKDTLRESKPLRTNHPETSFVFTGEVRLRKPLFEVLYG